MASYLTDRYRTTDPARICSFLDDFPFATLIPASGPMNGTLGLPLLLRSSAPGGEIVLFGHLDNNNPFLPHLAAKRVSAVFTGPNGYISPVDYRSDQFPTWNYATARVDGVSNLIQDEEHKAAYMADTVAKLETRNGTGYRLDLADGRVARLLRNITFFQLCADSASGIFKFSQDKSAVDREAACGRLLEKLRVIQESAVPSLAGCDDRPESGQNDHEARG